MSHSPRRLAHRRAYRSVRASQKQPPLRGRAAASELETRPLRSVAIKRPPSISKPVIVHTAVKTKAVKTVSEQPSPKENALPLKSPEIRDDQQDFVLPQISLRYGKWWLLLVILIGCLAIAQQLL